MTRNRLDRATIDDLLDKFEDKFGPIKQSSRSKYSSLVSGLKPKEFRDETALIDYILLFSYVAGDRLIVDRDSRKKRHIKGLDDLRLFSYTNINSKNQQGERNNLELFRLCGRIDNRHHKFGAPSWSQTLDRIFKEKEVVKYLRAEASYRQHVAKWGRTEEVDYELLKQYVLGKKLIVDRKSPKRRKRITSLKDLALLSNSNAASKDPRGKPYNPELSGLNSRINTRHQRFNTPRWHQTLDKIFKEKEVKEYLRAEASYKQHVMEKQRTTPAIYTEEENYELLKQYVLGKKFIVDRDSGKKRRIKGLDDLTLLSISNVYSKNQQGEKNNPELFRLYCRIGMRRHKFGRPNWGQTLNRIFKEKEVKEYLGARASYKQHAIIKEPRRSSTVHTEERDYEVLKQYVLGKKFIVDWYSGKKRRIKGLDDLALLSYSNINPKNKKGKENNPKLFRLYCRFIQRRQRLNAPNWQQTLDKLFKEKEVVKYLGAEATYVKYVRVVSAEKLKPA